MKPFVIAWSATSAVIGPLAAAPTSLTDLLNPSVILIALSNSLFIFLFTIGFGLFNFGLLSLLRIGFTTVFRVLFNTILRGFSANGTDRTFGLPELLLFVGTIGMGYLVFRIDASVLAHPFHVEPGDPPLSPSKNFIHALSYGLAWPLSGLAGLIFENRYGRR